MTTSTDINGRHHDPLCPYGQTRLATVIQPEDCHHCRRLAYNPICRCVTCRRFDHDPLCRAHYKAATPVEHCADCDLIARVRAEYEMSDPHEKMPRRCPDTADTARG